MQKRKVSWQEFQGLVAKICRDISKDNWRPDYIVGITRGGLLPAVMISQYFNIPCETLKVSLRDHGGENPTESNLWMAEDAFAGKNILIVDDINDTGATFNWILKDWPSGIYSEKDWTNDIWNTTVKFAVLVDNLASECKVKMNYTAMEINKVENDVWVDFPWETWWTK